MVTSELAISTLAETLRAHPTVRLGDDLDPPQHDALVAWAHTQDLKVLESGTALERPATLAVTTRPAHATGAPWVHCPFAGVEHLAPDLPDGVLLTRTTGTMPQRIAEYVLAWVLADRWQTGRYLADSASATWDPSDPPAPAERDGAVVIGTGAVGRAIGRALAATGHHVTGLSRSGRPDDAFDVVLPHAQAHVGLGPSNARTDVIVLALPHTPQTVGLVTPELLQAFDGVHLINIGRGSAIRTETLLGALDAGHVRRATLDVTEPEPLDSASPLWRRPDVTITPHVSGLTLPSDVVADLGTALDEIRTGVRPTSAVARDRGY